MSTTRIDLATAGTSSDESMIAAARRVVSQRPQGAKETAAEREFRLRPSGDSAGRVVYPYLYRQLADDVPLEKLGV